MQFPHPLSDLLGSFWVADVSRREGFCTEILFEAAIFERPKDPGADIPFPQTAQNLEFALPIDQVFHLGPIDAQKELSGSVVSFTMLRPQKNIFNSIDLRGSASTHQ